MTWADQYEHRAWLSAESRRLLAFGRHAGLAAGGAAYLDDAGVPDARHGVQTWITCRTVHVFSVGALLGIPGSAPVARQALAGLRGRLRDTRHGGWFHAVSADEVADIASGKSCYDHAFVLLAASSAVLAELPGADDLLAEATDTYLERFWDETTGRPIDTWDVAFQRADDYRGLNSAMHSVEAMLSVAGAVPATDSPVWLDRALSVLRFVVELARKHDGRLPEHFAPDWTPELGLNRDQPDDKFKPFGATPGHGLEWARLLLHAEAAIGGDAELVATAVHLFDTAVRDGWSVDGADGFVYTTDWDGSPVVRDRMHWVVAQAVNTAAALHTRTGEMRYEHWYRSWWDYISDNLIDTKDGSWFHQLNDANSPIATVWPGKPDLYHAFQATLVPRLRLTPMIARAVKDGSIA